MSVSKFASGGFAALILRWANGLRFPYLFLLTLVLFVANLFVPDVLPMVDELLMGLVALMFASLKRRGKEVDSGDVEGAENAIEARATGAQDNP